MSLHMSTWSVSHVRASSIWTQCACVGACSAARAAWLMAKFRRARRRRHDARCGRPRKRARRHGAWRARRTPPWRTIARVRAALIASDAGTAARATAFSQRRRCTGAPLRGLRRLRARARTGTMRVRPGTTRARSVAQPLAPTRRADPSQRIMAVSQLIAHMGVRVDPADVEEALRELPPGASVLDWYGQMTAKERARCCVVGSVLMAVHARALHGDAWDPLCSPRGVQPVPGVWPAARACMWECAPPAAEPSWPAASSPSAWEAPVSPASDSRSATEWAHDAQTTRDVRPAVGREPPVEATLLEPPVGGGPDSAGPAPEPRPQVPQPARRGLVQATPPETGGRPDVRGLYEELAAAGLSPKLFWWQCPELLAMVTAIESWRQRALGVQPELHTCAPRAALRLRPPPHARCAGPPRRGVVAAAMAEGCPVPRGHAAGRRWPGSSLPRCSHRAVARARH